MKIFGSWKELVKLVFRTDTQEVELQPDSATTYTATRTISLPPGDSNQSLVGTAGAQTLTNKTIVVANNTITTAASGNLTSTELNAALDELQDSIDTSDGALATHISDSSTHGVTGDILGTTDTQAVSNKTIDADLNTITNIDNANIKVGAAIDAAKLADGSVDNTEFQKLGTAGTAGAGNLVTTDGTQTLSDKKLADTTTIVDTTDPTIEVQIASNGSASTKTTLVAVQSANRTITLPDASTTLVGTDNTQNLSGKNFTDSPSFDVGLLLDHTTTPSTPTGAVAVYSKNDNKVYKKGADGIESEIGSGSGQGTLNIVDNASADSGTTGWTAATNYTVARNTTDSPLEGVIDTCFAISTTTASSESSTSGVYAASLANPVAFQNIKLQLSMYVTVPASSLGVWRVSVYNSSGTRVSLSTDSSGATTLPEGFSGQFAASFDSDSGATYTVSITQTTRTSANTLYATNISIGNKELIQGAIVGPIFNLASLGATTANFGSKGIASFSCYGQRIGSSLRVTFNITTNTTASGGGANNIQLVLPSAYASATSLMSSAVGSVSTYGINTLNQYDETTPIYSETTTTYRFVNPGTGAYYTTSSINNTNLNVLDGFFTIPVAAWVGGGTVNLGQNDVEYVYNTSTATAASDTTSFGYGPQGAQIQNITAQLSRRVRFLSPIQAGDSISFEVSTDRTSWFSIEAPYVTGANIESFRAVNGVTYGVGRASPQNSTDVDFAFGTYAYSGTAATFGAAGQAYSAGAGAYYWRVKKTKAGAAVGFGLASNVSSGLAPSGVFNVGESGVVALQELTATPSNPATSSEAKVYLKADKIVFQFNDAGTVRYKYLDLTGTGVTWVHTTTAP